LSAGGVTRMCPETNQAVAPGASTARRGREKRRVVRLL
jgi:hypothetical protein